MSFSGLQRDLTCFFRESTVGPILEGFLKGFALYYVPMTLLRRKLLAHVFRRAVAIGLFASTFKVIRQIGNIRKVDEQLEEICERFSLNKDRLLCAFSGSIGAMCAALFDKTIITSLFILWCFTRALRFVLPTVPYGSTLVMCLAAAQIGTTWVKRPKELDTSYRKFLISQGGKRASVLEMLQNNDIPLSLICSITHPGEGCVKHGVTYMLKSFMRGVKLYIPLQLFFYFLSSQKSIPRYLMALIRSSLFMALYCSGAWVGPCLGFSPAVINQTNTFSSALLFSRLWICGLATLIEKPSRRPELAQYCTTYALDTVYQYFRIRNVVQPSTFIGFILLCASWYVLLWNHESLPSFVSQWMLQIPKPKEETE